MQAALAIQAIPVQAIQEAPQEIMVAQATQQAQARVLCNLFRKDAIGWDWSDQSLYLAVSDLNL